MGTRADFYVGRGKEAEWLGSIALDGYPGGIDKVILRARKESDFRKAVKEFLSGRDDGTFPKQGWPWPWEDSNTTDYAYAFHKGKVYGSCFGSEWFSCYPLREKQDDDSSSRGQEFPNMKSKMALTFGKRSGLILVAR
jgi:hypothetical protein